MTEPQDVSSLDLDSIVLARRFSVEQGVGADGLPKIRAVDDESGNCVNSFCEPSEKLHHDRCDMFARLIALFAARSGVLPWIFKCDVDSAFRRIPVNPAHRWLLWVVVKSSRGVLAARHNACPFGCTASVHHWNRVGAMLRHLALCLLRQVRYSGGCFSPW